MKEVKSVRESFKEDKNVLSFDFVGADGLVIPSNELKLLNYGANGSVWKWDDGFHTQAVKSFFDGRYRLSLPLDICLIMQKLNFINLPNIYSPLSRSNKSGDSYDAYLMEYFNELDGAKLTELPSHNLILSIEQIEEDSKNLAEHQIVMFDVKPGNSIVTQEDLMLHFVDLDLYKKVSDKSYEELLGIQQKMIMSFLSMKFRKDIQSDDTFSIINKQRIVSFLRQYFSFSTNYTLSPREQVENLFSNVDNPKQYFKKLL